MKTQVCHDCQEKDKMLCVYAITYIALVVAANQMNSDHSDAHTSGIRNATLLELCRATAVLSAMLLLVGLCCAVLCCAMLS